MKWETCTLVNPEITGYDELGNEIKKDADVQTVFGRFTPFTETDLHIEGRTVTQNSRKVLIRKPLSGILPCEKIQIDGLQYRISEKSAAGRFTILYVERTGADDV